MKEITSSELQEAIDSGATFNIIDVRRDEEVAKGIIPTAKHIILDELPNRLNELKKDETYHIVCRSGGRSSKACEYLVSKGYNVINVDGGMLDWKGETE